MNASQKTRRDFFTDAAAASGLLLAGCSRSSSPKVAGSEEIAPGGPAKKPLSPGHGENGECEPGRAKLR